MDAIDLSGRTAIVTGASSGIGASTVRKLREVGVRVAGGARRVERIDADVALELDVTDEASRQRSSRRPWPRSAVVSTSSSTTRDSRSGAPRSPSRRPTTRSASSTRTSTGCCGRRVLVLPHIRDGGHIVFMGSIAGRQPYPGGASYIASKYAVRGFSYAIREDLLGRPIRVTTVDAGLVETEFSVVRFRGDQAAADKVYEGLDPVTPDEVADCVLFALTRPPHVNLDEIVIKAIAQSSGAHVVRRST